MTIVTKEQLKSRFRNGALPQEQDFAALIDALVHEDEFAAWTKQGELELGLDDDKWRLRVRDTSLTAERVGRDGGTAPAVLSIDAGSDDAPAVVGIAALATLQGRIGAYYPSDDNHPSAIDAATPGINLRSAKADGNWQPVIQNLPGCAAFEIVAHMGWDGARSTSSAPDVTWYHVLWSLLGLRRSDSAMVHAIALNPAPGTRPSLRQTAAPGRRGWRAAIRDLCWLGFISSIGVLSLKQGTGNLCWGLTFFDFGCAMSNVAMFGLVISVIGLLVAWRTTRQELRFAWRRQGSSPLSPHARYDLYLRGHARRGSGDEKIHYHVTRLW